MKVFISRICDENSIFRKILTEKSIALCDESLIDFSPLDFHLPQDYDWLFFYSKKGVEYFFAANPKLSNLVKIAALGMGTAAGVLQYAAKTPDFSGDGIPESTAESFKKIAAGQRVLFVRAMESKKSVQNLLSRELTVLELIAYKNVPKIDFAKADADILVFTSSLNAETYLKKYPAEKNQILAAIGKPSAESIAALGYKDVFCSDSPDETALADLVLKIFENNKP
jgi:uroporphyrinogen-III synthase